jgi:hypothetical protein
MVANFSEGSPSFILLAIGLLERSDASLSCIPSIGVVVVLRLVPCTPKVYPQGVG